MCRNIRKYTAFSNYKEGEVIVRRTLSTKPKKEGQCISLLTSWKDYQTGLMVFSEPCNDINMVMIIASYYPYSK